MKIAPSLLAANFLHLADDIQKISDSNADYLHIDIMDGMFVPNISFGFTILDALQGIMHKPLDIHLMIEEPARYIKQLAKYKPAIVTVHAEADRHLYSTIQAIHSIGAKAGVAINPCTSVDVLKDVIKYCDVVLIMTVEPGFGGQSFIYETMSKVETVKQWREQLAGVSYHLSIEADGGINADTIYDVSEAGADIAVAGSYVFKSANVGDAIDLLRNYRS